jgi:hypothetical protein
MNIDHIPGHVLAFSNTSDDELADKPVLIEVTDSARDGTIELAFDAPLAKSPRIYVRLRLQDLMAALMKQVKPE